MHQATRAERRVTDANHIEFLFGAEVAEHVLSDRIEDQVIMNCNYTMA